MSRCYINVHVNKQGFSQAFGYCLCIQAHMIWERGSSLSHAEAVSEPQTQKAMAVRAVKILCTLLRQGWVCILTVLQKIAAMQTAKRMLVTWSAQLHINTEHDGIHVQTTD